jgi:guanyl-specific ribonuclease Sa
VRKGVLNVVLNVVSALMKKALCSTAESGVQSAAYAPMTSLWTSSVPSTQQQRCPAP